MKDLQTKAFELLNTKFGNKAQMVKAIEELAELNEATNKLIQGLCHYLNKDVNDGSHMDVDRLDIMSEIADVQIVTGFLIKIFDFNQDNIDMIKIDKLNKVIKNNE